MPWEVTYSLEAASQLADAKLKAAANPNGAHGAFYDAITKVIRDVISNADLVLLPQNMLKGNLAGVLRVKTGRRQRVFYLASSQTKRAVVLLLGYRKDGDKNDAYAVLERLLRRGSFDAHFAELGVTKPKR